MRRFSSLQRVRQCGWALCSNEQGASIRVSTVDGIRSAGVGGVQTCGSYWSCPVCSEKIALRRREEIEKIARWWVEEKGGRIGFVTMTVRHSKRQSLTAVWDAVAAGWTAATSGRAWVNEQAVHGVMMRRVVKPRRVPPLTCPTAQAIGLVPSVRVVVEPRIRIVRITEVTYGRFGWHVHVHALLLLRGDVTGVELDAIGARMFGRWKRGLRKSCTRTAACADVCSCKGFSASGTKVRRKDGSWGPAGYDARLFDGVGEVAQYVTKHGTGSLDSLTSLSFEAAAGMRKDGRRGNVTPFGMLGGLVNGVSAAERVEDWARAWGEWEQGSKGRRAIAYTPGLLDEAGVREVSDEEIAAEEAGGVDVAVVEAPLWRFINEQNGVVDLLEVFEDSIRGGKRLLAWWEVAHAEWVDPWP